MIAGYLADIFGRKKVMIANAVPMIFGTLFIALAENLYFLIFGRIISGFAVGKSHFYHHLNEYIFKLLGYLNKKREIIIDTCVFQVEHGILRA